MKRAQESGITIELVGGLGNQLFLYSMGFELSKFLNCPLYIDKTWYRTQRNRNFEIGSITDPALLTSKRPIIKRMEVQAQKLLPPKVLKHAKVFVERDSGYDAEVLRVSIGWKLRGYFQSWKYFQWHADEIRNQLQDVPKPSTWYKDRLRQFSDEGEWISIHVRRGDYLHPKTREFHGILDSKYYERAIERMDSELGRKLPIRVFSDDSSVARGLFRARRREIHYVQETPTSVPMETMLLMSRGSGIITANSSFSWWSAWVQDSDNRPVIVPSRWFKNRPTNHSDLFLSNWITLC
jgi:hypothetical protein